MERQSSIGTLYKLGERTVALMLPICNTQWENYWRLCEFTRSGLLHLVHSNWRSWKPSTMGEHGM